MICQMDEPVTIPIAMLIEKLTKKINNIVSTHWKITSGKPAESPTILIGATIATAIVVTKSGRMYSKSPESIWLKNS